MAQIYRVEFDQEFKIFDFGYCVVVHVQTDELCLIVESRNVR